MAHAAKKNPEDLARRLAYGRNVKTVLRQRDKKIRALARFLGVSEQSTHARLSGKVAVPIEELIAVARWLEVDPAQLLSGEGVVPAISRQKTSKSAVRRRFPPNIPIPDDRAA